MQVLLLMPQEFTQLQQQYGEPAVAEKGQGREGAGAPPRLSLGTDLLKSDQDFAEGVCLTLVEVRGEVA